MICAPEPEFPTEAWRISFLHSPETFHVQSAPLRPLLVKELWEILSGRALWTMLLLMCPLLGYSFLQATSLYGEASVAGLQSPVLASSLSPLDGVLVPTLGASYVAVTLLFPFVAIRVLGQEKESGALRLLVQLPYRPPALIAAKLAAVLAALVLSSIPAFSALVIWGMQGGHLSAPESAATAAIVTLAFTIGSWVLDFTVAGQPGLLAWIARLSLTQILRTFEQGLLSAGLVLGIGAAMFGFAALANVWLPPGVQVRDKVIRSIAWVLVVALVLGLATQIKLTFDVTEDRRNSFPAADQHLLASLAQPLVVTVNLAPEDPRYADLQRNVLAKLERAMPNVSIRLASGRQSQAATAGEDRYGEVEYAYGARSDVSRSTSPREILPMLYGLAGVSPPAPAPGSDYPGYPLVAGRRVALLWFFAGLPLCIALAWRWNRRLPKPITARS